MKKWQCQVCGYIHEGDEPPDQCPVCGADKKLFQEIGASAGEKSKPAEKEKVKTAKAKKWRCTVCGYIHEGDEPPDQCPVCGADKSLFEPVLEEASAEVSAKEEKKSPAAPIKNPRKIDLGPAPEAGKERILHIAMEQILKHHVHPVSVHIPNGVLPVSFIFLILAAISGSDALRIAACCNMIFVVLSMPLVLFTGYVEWKKRYKGFVSKRFLTKILCAAIVAATSLAVAVWLLIEPDVLSAESGHLFVFLLTNLIMLGAAATAGFIGGKLVFRD
ncbi:MAG: rubredoxin-like domain-containing protein [Desulfococcaceae bacterium]